MTFDTLRMDLRFALRSLRLHPVFTAAALSTLTVGIGGTVALFSVLRSIVLDPPEYEAPGRVVNLFETRERQAGRTNMSYLDVIDVRDRAVTLSGVAARQTWDPTLVGDSEPRRLEGGSVSASFFNVLGVRPAAGRLFDAGDGAPGHDPVVVLSHRLWSDRFGADPTVISRTVDLSGTSYTIVGVAPAGFEDTDGPNDIWRADPPFFDVNVQSRTGHSFRPTARIAPGYQLADVNAELAQINAELVRQYPEKRGDGMIAVPAMDVLVGESRPAIVLLFGAVSLLLLIACANVANLLLSRGTARQREMAIRSAIGAAPGRLTVQLLLESSLLAALGGLAGIALASVVVPTFVGLSEAIPRSERIGIDPLVVTFAIIVTAVVGIGFGLAPAWMARRVPVAELRDGQRIVDRTRGWTLRNVLIVGELALSLMLLSGAGLLVRSFLNLQSVDKGVRTDDVITMKIRPPSSRGGHANLTRYWEEVIARVSALPGVRVAGAVSFLPMSGGYEGQGVYRTDRPRPGPGQNVGAEARAVTPEYFRAIGIDLVRGRALTAADDSAAKPVIVVNETLVRQMFSGEEALGKSLMVNGGPHEIVGIVRDVRQFGVQSPVRPEMYAPHAQPFVSWIRGSMDLVVHTEVDPLSLAPAIRAAVWAVDPAAPIADVKTMERWAAEDISGPRFRTVLLGVFAGIALLLATVGITGVLSYAVGRRIREFGIRAALGATGGSVVRLVMLHGIRVVAAGVVIGVGGSLASANLLRSVLHEVSPTDPFTLIAVTAVVVITSFTAMLAPALRAAQVSPLVAMRAE